MLSLATWPKVKSAFMPFISKGKVGVVITAAMQSPTKA